MASKPVGISQLDFENGNIAENWKRWKQTMRLMLQGPASSPGSTVTVGWVLRGKHSRKRAVGPGRKRRKKCMIPRKSDKIVFY